MTEKIKPQKFNLKAHAFGMVGVLVLEFLLGMSTNLFINFPQSEKGDKLWEFAKTQMLLMTHIVVGLLLLLGTIALFVRAIKIKNDSWITTSSIALASIIGAAISGAIFVPSQMEIYSFLMACFFIFALLSYFWGIYSNK